MNVSDSTKPISNSANHSTYFPYKYLAPNTNVLSNALGDTPAIDDTPNTENLVDKHAPKPNKKTVRWERNNIKKFKKRMSHRQNKTEKRDNYNLNSKHYDSNNILLEKPCQLAFSAEDIKQ